MNITEEKPLDIVSEDALISMPASSTNKSPRPSVKKTRRFTTGLLIYACCLLLLVGGALWYVGDGLSQHQASTPTKAMNQYLTLVQAKDYEAIYASSGFQETLLNTKSDYIQYLERLYNGDPNTITLQEQLSSDPSVQQYALYFDDKPVSTVYAVFQNGEWSVSTKLNYLPSYTVYAAPEMTVTVNGNDLALLDVPHTQAQQTLFKGLDGKGNYPAVMCYTLEGLLNPPHCTAYTLDGTACTVVSHKTDPYSLYVSNQTITASLESLVKTVIADYACFIAGDSKRQTMLKHVHKDSAAYEELSVYDNRQFERHTAYDLGDIQITDPLSFTEFDYTCTATLCPTYAYKGETFGGDRLTCRLTFIKFEEEWLLISLENISLSSSDNHIDTTIQTEESP